VHEQFPTPGTWRKKAKNHRELAWGAWNETRDLPAAHLEADADPAPKENPRNQQ